MTDLVSWLRAQFDHDEQVARAATPGPWVREWAFSTHFVVPEAAGTTAAGNVSRLKPDQRADAEHIALHDPPTVLRTVAAHRVILDAYENERDYTQRFPSVQVDELAGLQTALLAVVGHDVVDTYSPGDRPKSSYLAGTIRS